MSTGPATSIAGLRSRLSLKTRRPSSTEGVTAPRESTDGNEDPRVTSPRAGAASTQGESFSTPSIASNADRSPYGGIQDDKAPTTPVAPAPTHRRLRSWASSRHQRTPSGTSQAFREPVGSAEQPRQGSPTNDDSTPRMNEMVPQKKIKSQPLTTELDGNPLEQQLAYIVRFFLFGGVAVVIVARYVNAIVAIVLAAVLAFVLRAQLTTRAKDAAWQRSAALATKQHEQDDADQTESVEWMNAILKTVWPLITPDYFVPFIDLLEDALMQQVPGIVHSCRVEDLDQGNIPLLMQSFTLLDSSLESFSRGAQDTDSPIDVGGDDDDSHKADAPSIDVGDHINMEVTFAYRSPNARKQKTKSNRGDTVMSDQERQDLQQAVHDSDIPVDQIHMLIYMSIGLQKLAAVEVPVWCEVLGIEGKMRLRIQLVPTAPFVGHVAFTFMGMPKLEISAKPLGRRMVIDAMHLPLISSYVLHSVEAVVKPFISPKSYTIDVASLLDAKDGPRNVYSLGVIVLIVHQAYQLPAADNNGSSDPFVSVSFAKAGKPIFTTRVLLRTRDPIWHEMAVLLVSPDEVRDHEQLRMTVFDADRFSVDDPLGKVDISIDKLIKRALSQSNSPKKPSLLEIETRNLQPMRRGKQAEGKLRFSVGFFRLAKPSRAERTVSKQRLLVEAAERHNDVDQAVAASQSDIHSEQQTNDKEAESNDEILNAFATPFDRFITKLGLPLDDRVLQRRKERSERVQTLRNMVEGEAKATLGPPNTEWSSGILAFHIHSIDGLGFEPPQRSYTNSKRLNQKPRYADEADPLGESASKMPNSYVQVIINDEPVFRSRTKTLNPRPYINAGSERFIADFSSARIDFVVRDQRQRESDAILGVVGLPLGSILKDECRLTQWYTMSGGLGFGKIRITLLWRSAEINIPRPLRGWNVGVLEIASCYAGGLSSSLHRAGFDRRDAHLLFETVGGRAETDSVEPQDEYESGDGDKATFALRWPISDPIRIAVRQRYPNFLYVHLRMDSRVPGRARKFAHAVIPLIWLVDDKESKHRVPLYETGLGTWQQFEQDVMHNFTNANEDLAGREPAEHRAPVLEDLCNTEAADESRRNQTHTCQDDAKLQRIGFLDVVLFFHAGIAPEHKSLVAGDHEMRVAYESWITLVDNNQRPKPKMLSADRRRKLSNAGSLPSPKIGLEEKGSGGNERASLGSRSEITHTRSAEARKKGKPDTQDDENGREEDDDDDSAWSISDAESEARGAEEYGLVETNTPEGRRARIRSLHRQQRGAAQIKSYRTLEWLKTNAEDGFGRIRSKAARTQQKRISKMESEGVSHF